MKKHRNQNEQNNLLVSKETLVLFQKTTQQSLSINDYFYVIANYKDSQSVGDVIAKVIIENKFNLESIYISKAISIYVYRFGVNSFNIHDKLKTMIYVCSDQGKLYCSKLNKNNDFYYYNYNISIKEMTNLAGMYAEKMSQITMIRFYAQYNELEKCNFLVEKTLSEVAHVVKCLRTDVLYKELQSIFFNNAYITLQHLIRPEKLFESLLLIVKQLTVDPVYLVNIINDLNFAVNSVPEDIVKYIYPMLDKLFQDEKTLDTKLFGKCCYNLGMVYEKLLDFNNATKYYQIAFEYLPDDIDVIENLNTTLSILGNKEDINKYWNTITNKELVKLFKYTSDIEDIDIRNLKAIKKNSIPKELRPRLEIGKWIAYLLNQHKKGISISESKVENEIENLKSRFITLDYTVFIKLCIKLGLKTTAQKLLKEIPKDVLSYHFGLEFLKIEVVALNKKLIEEIQKYRVSDVQKVSLLYHAAMKLFTKKQYAKVEEFVRAGEQYKDNDDLISIGIHAAIMSQNTEFLKQYLERGQIPNGLIKIVSYLVEQVNVEKSKGSNEKTNPIIMNQKDEDNSGQIEEKRENVKNKTIQDDTIEEIFKNYSPKEIHQYYQNLKLEKSTKLTTQEKPKTQWQIKQNLINSTDPEVIKIGEFQGDKYYAMLGEKILKNKTITGIYTQLIAALGHGFVTKNHCSNGVKYLNFLFELKTNYDIRAYSNTIYKNINTEKILIIFDHVANHEGIKKLNFDKLNIVLLGDEIDNIVEVDS